MSDKMDPSVEKIYVDSPVSDPEDDEKYKYVSTNVEDFDEGQHQAFLDGQSGLGDQSKWYRDDDDGNHGSSVTKSSPGRDQSGSNRMKTNPFDSLHTDEDDMEELRREEAYQESLRRRLSDQHHEAERLHIPPLNLPDDEDNPAGGGKIHEISIRDSLDDEMPRNQAKPHHMIQDAEHLESVQLIHQQTEPPGGWSQQLQQHLIDENMSVHPSPPPHQHLQMGPHSGMGRTSETNGDLRLKLIFPTQRPGPPQFNYSGSQAPPYEQSQNQNGYSYQEAHPQQYPEYLADTQRIYPQGPSSQTPEHGYGHFVGAQPFLPGFPPPPPFALGQFQPQQPIVPHFQDQNPDTQYSQNPSYGQHEQYQEIYHTHQPHQHAGSRAFYGHGLCDESQKPTVSSHYANQGQDHTGHHFVHGPVAPSYDYQGQHGPTLAHNIHGQQVVYQRDDVYNETEGPSEHYSSHVMRARCSPAYTEVPKKEKPKIDFLERNKRDYSKAAAGAKHSYGQLFMEKQKVKENVSPTSTREKSKPGPSPVKAIHNPHIETQSTFGSEDEIPPKGTEIFWSRRAQTLADAKRERSSGVRKLKRAPLQKYPSESHVDDIKVVHSAPPQLQPVSLRRQHALTEPIRSEVDPYQPAGVTRPVTHTIYTDDGQRVSVDINLKLVSPPHPPPLQYSGPPSSGYEQQHPLGTSPHNGTGLLYQQDPSHGYGVYPDREHLPVERMTPVSNRSNPPGGKIPTPIGSPYMVLPPIHLTEAHKGARSQTQSKASATPNQRDASPRNDNTSYLAEMKKKKERKPVDYKQYTVNDYKKLRHEIRMGGLGPDMDSETLKEKREKRDKQLEYAQLVKDKNRRGLETSPKKPLLRQREESPSDDLLNRRRIAMEYAKSVPKPKTRLPAPPSARSGGPSPVMASPQRPAPASSTPQESEFDELAKLRERHEREKQQVAMIRQNMEGMAGQV